MLNSASSGLLWSGVLMIGVISMWDVYCKIGRVSGILAWQF